MPIKIPNAAERDLLDLIRENWNVWVHLLQPGTTIDDDTVLEDLQALEADYDDYAAQQVSSWTIAATDGTGRAYTVSSTVTFPLPGSGSQDIMGWYMDDAETAGTEFWGVNQYPSTITYETTSTAIEVTVVFKLRQEPP